MLNFPSLQKLKIASEIIQMKLQAIVLENFRGYKNRTRVAFDDLTAFIGKNDFGKSTILDALEIFFNSELVKIDSEDANKYSDSAVVTIGCVFSDWSDQLVLDDSVLTSLEDEFLLNADGLLEIHKIYNTGASRISARVCAIANHPSIDQANDLLSLTNAQLKSRFRELELDENSTDLRSNPALRQAIWQSFSPDELACMPTEISLNETNTKDIWGKIEEHLPTYALFRADRPSTDSDAEVQDPMKLAIKEALSSVQGELDKIRDKVQSKAVDVANRTLAKLREMQPDLANELKPQFTSEPKWDGFKLTITGDDNIPINKRGSGVRRLILLNFFRAEAERKAQEQNKHNIIYAVEEPEVSQHPEYQEMLIKSLIELSKQDNQQVIITTHIPRLAGLLPVDSIRHITRDADKHPQVLWQTPDVMKNVATELGVLPNPEKINEIAEHLQVLICVEGTSDVQYLKHIFGLLHRQDTTLPNIETDSRVRVIPLYGSNLIQWVTDHYFEGTGINEYHIYDRDDDNKYKDACDTINNRPDDSIGRLTVKLSIENYFPIDVINSVFQLSLTSSELSDKECDVVKLILKEVRGKSNKDPIRKSVVESDQKKTRINIKYKLHTEGRSQIQTTHLSEIDSDSEIRGWLQAISELLT